jgi:hypothetical protein
MFIRLMLEKNQPIVLNLNHVLSIALVGPRATIKLIHRDVLTVEHSFNEVCDLMARVLGGKHRLVAQGRSYQAAIPYKRTECECACVRQPGRNIYCERNRIGRLVNRLKLWNTNKSIGVPSSAKVEGSGTAITWPTVM